MNQYEALLANMQEFGDYSPAAIEAFAKAKREAETQTPVPTKHTWRTSFKKAPAKKPEAQTQTVTQPKETLMSIDPRTVMSIDPSRVASLPQNTNAGGARVGNLLAGGMLAGGVAALGGAGYGLYNLGKHSMDWQLSASAKDLEKMTAKYNRASNLWNKTADQLDAQTKALNKANVYGKQIKTRYNNLKSNTAQEINALKNENAMLNLNNAKPRSLDFNYTPNIGNMDPNVVKEQLNQALSARGISLNPQDLTKPISRNVWDISSSLPKAVWKSGRKTATKESLSNVVGSALKSL